MGGGSVSECVGGGGLQNYKMTMLVHKLRPQVDSTTIHNYQIKLIE